MRRTWKSMKAMNSKGFTLVEVLISMAITIIVMGAVFGLLTRGQRSFEREPQVADLQQSARTALDMVSKDVLQAGSGLPPEFPSFTPKDVDPTVGDQGANPDVIEIVGASQPTGQLHFDRVRIEAFDGTSVMLVGERDTGMSDTGLQLGDLVAIYSNYNSTTNEIYWALRWVVDEPVEGVHPSTGHPVVELSLSPSYNGVTVPPSYSRYEGFAAPDPFNGYITRVSVVRYQTEMDGTDLILMRQVDFGQRNPVGLVDDFQVVYLVGTQPQMEQIDPPHPQPAVGVPLTPADIVSGVRVTVAARSASENLEGASPGASGNYIRKSFSSNISPRNVLNGLAERTGGLGAN
jgi:type II secretory pathway pseudopilin PulG